jgi:hypothetical protein
MNRVRKNGKKVTELRDHMLVNGEMSFHEIKDWMNARIRMGVTSNWLGNILAKSGLFDKVGMVSVPGYTGNNKVTIWEARKDE